MERGGVNSSNCATIGQYARAFEAAKTKGDNLTDDRIRCGDAPYPHACRLSSQGAFAGKRTMKQMYQQGVTYEMKKRITHATCFLGIAVLGGVSLAGCRAQGLNGDCLRLRPDGHGITYTPLNLIAHSCERLVDDQESLVEIQIVRPKAHGLDEKSAIVYGNYYVIPDERYRHIPQIYPLILRTDDGGRTWVQVLDPVTYGMSDLVELRFVDNIHGRLAWEHHIEGPAFGMLSTFNGGYTWEESCFHGIYNLSSLGDWSFSSPWNGECIVYAQAPFPFAGDVEKEIAYWKMNTTDGGRNWHVTETIAKDDPVKMAGNPTVPECAWMAKSTRWRVDERDEDFAVQLMKNGGDWKTVLSLPQVPYRATQ